MKLRLSLESEGIPEAHISWEPVDPTDITSELILAVSAQGMSQTELAGTLIDIAQTLTANPDALNGGRRRFNPQPRGRAQ